MFESGQGSRKLPVDIKTRCSTGTAGIVVIAPTPGKAWIASLATHAPPPIPDELVRWIDQKLCRNKSEPEAPKKRRRRDSPPRAPGTPPLLLVAPATDAAAAPRRAPAAAPCGRILMQPSVDVDADALRALGLDPALTVLPVSYWESAKVEGRRGYTFKNTTAGCPLCHQAEAHTNSYQVVYDECGRRHLQNLASACGFLKRVQLADTPRSVAAAHATFRRQLRPFATTVVAAVRHWAAAHEAGAALRDASRGWAGGRRWYFSDDETDGYVEVWPWETAAGGAKKTTYLLSRRDRPWMREGLDIPRDTVALPWDAEMGLMRALNLGGSEARN